MGIDTPRPLSEKIAELDGDNMNIMEEIKNGEGYNLEFKLLPNEDRAKSLKTVGAFANAPGGYIVLGRPGKWR